MTPSLEPLSMHSRIVVLFSFVETSRANADALSGAIGHGV